MSILIVLFGLLSDCLLSVLVGIIGSSRRIGFGQKPYRQHTLS